MTCDYIKLQQSGQAYPRTCPECGLGPCKYRTMTAAIKDAGDDVVEQDAVIGLAQHWRDCDYPAPTDVTRALANGVIRILSAYKLACVERDELKVKILKCENDRLCALCGEAIDQARNK